MQEIFLRIETKIVPAGGFGFGVIYNYGWDQILPERKSVLSFGDSEIRLIFAMPGMVTGAPNQIESRFVVLYNGNVLEGDIEEFKQFIRSFHPFRKIDPVSKKLKVLPTAAAKEDPVNVPFPTKLVERFPILGAVYDAEIVQFAQDDTTPVPTWRPTFSKTLLAPAYVASLFPGYFISVPAYFNVKLYDKSGNIIFDWTRVPVRLTPKQKEILGLTSFSGGKI